MSKSLQNDLEQLKSFFINQLDATISNLQQNAESKEYGACTYELNGKKVIQRFSKITPTKTGQFVTIWKRDANGITAPFDASDDFDLIIITSRDGEKLGHFVFPKSILIEKGIISTSGKGGKRGMRVYPSWDLTENKQAKKTQDWQQNFFFSIGTNDDQTFNFMKVNLI